MALALLAGWIVFSYAFAEFAPIILVGLCHLIGFLFLCLWEVIKLIAKALGWLIGRILRTAGTALLKCGQGLHLGLLFLFYLADEWWRGPAEEQEDAFGDEGTGDHDDTEDRGGAPCDPYEDALARLGLGPGFTPADLKRAYKQAMKIAHPDAGGSPAAAQAVNAARDLIARRHGWK